MRKSVKLGSLVLLMLAHAQAAHADLIVKPYSWVPGQVLPADELNADFNVIYNNYNGNITNQNIKTGALIDPAKLDTTKAYGPILRAATNQCFGVSTSGDSSARFAVWTDGSIRLGGGTSQDTQLLRSAAGQIDLKRLIPSVQWGTLRGQKFQSFFDADTEPTIVIDSDDLSGPPGGIFLGPGGNLPVDAKIVRRSGPIISCEDLTGNPIPISVSSFYINGSGPILPQSFGGSGANGVVSINTSALTGPRRYDAFSFAIPTGQVVTFNDGPITVAATSSVTITGTLTMGVSTYTNGGLGGGTGSTSLTGAPGGGAGGGTVSSYTGAGGNGGASAYFSGGSGGHNGTSGQAGTKQPASGVFYAQSGGGSGGNSIVMTATSNGGTGGSGKFALAILSNGTVTLANGSTINSIGTAGTAGVVSTTNNAAGGAGGGAGGSVILASQTLVTAVSGSTINVTGGAGGNAGRNASGNAGGGGGGAPGTVVVWAPSASMAGTITLAGGAGGTGIGTGDTGVTPSTGTLITVNGIPNLPLLAHYTEHPEQYGAVAAVVQIHQATGKTGPVDIPHNMMATIASEGDIVKYCKIKSERTVEPTADATCVTIGDNSQSEALKNAS